MEKIILSGRELSEKQSNVYTLFELPEITQEQVWDANCNESLLVKITKKDLLANEMDIDSVVYIFPKEEKDELEKLKFTEKQIELLTAESGILILADRFEKLINILQEKLK